MNDGLRVRDGTIVFPEPWTRATIVRRRNRFVIDVDLDGAVVGCHCPTTGRVGDLALDGLLCLLSPSRSSTRATPYTVEAISVDPPGTRAPAWIGINQNAANRFVEQALTHHLLPDMITVTSLAREQVLGGSRLDFLVDGHTYLEVKTPLENLQVTLGEHVQTRKRPPLVATDRLARHVGELGDSLAAQQRAILLVCFLYDNPGFQVAPSGRGSQVKAQVDRALRQGVEIWQVNFGLDPTGARVLAHHDLTEQFRT